MAAGIQPTVQPWDQKEVLDLVWPVTPAKRTTDNGQVTRDPPPGAKVVISESDRDN